MNFPLRTNKASKSRLYRTFITTAFLTNGLCQLVTPALAQTPPTSANTTINNQATATYEDPNSPPGTPPINTTSNTVTVTIAEVAGILLQTGTVNDVNGGTVQIGDALEYNFTVTNIGNDPTRFKIPDTVTVTGNGTVVANSLEYQQPGTSTWLPVPSGGVTTNSVPVNGVVPVRVRVTVNSGATNISVTLGQTNPANTASNSPRNDVASSNDTLDVYTVDNNNGTATGEVDGIPANLVVEGSVTATKAVDPKLYSLATLLKTRGAYSNNNTAGDITDDTFSYNLSLRVEPNDVTGQGIVPSPLAGSTVPGLSGSNILVSDAIPTGTELAAVPTAPSGWTVVYSTTVVTTSANAATWTTTQPALSTVTRIGFIKPTTDGDTNTYLPLTTGAVQPTQFTIQLKVKTGQTAPLTIANIAQVFGKTPTTNAPVFDESGDQNPSNFDGPPGNMTPPATTDTNGDGVPDQLPTTVDDGFINNPTTPETGVDTNSNNTGSGTGGEANSFTINTASVLNGPNGFPAAVGPTNNNDDFTNKSSNVPSGTIPGSTFDPNAVSFTNTVRNDGTQPVNISLLPTPPANSADLRTNTVVTISANNGATSATYTYNGTVFTFTSSVGTVGGNPINATNPVRIDGVAANGTSSYTVTVDLPANTPLSTDPNIQRGFPVPITAFIDSNGNGLADDGTTNITIDRVYTGFLQLLKFSALEQGTGPAVGTGQDNFASTPAVNGVDPDPNTPDVDRKPAPGNIIVYQIRYKNISEPQPASGSNNVILNAANVVITEDGTATPSNWAKDNDGNTVIDTSQVSGSALDSGASTITFFSGNPATTSIPSEQTGTTVNTDVTKYIDTITGTVAPGVPRTFTFKRKVN